MIDERTNSHSKFLNTAFHNKISNFYVDYINDFNVCVELKESFSKKKNCFKIASNQYFYSHFIMFDFYHHFFILHKTSYLRSKYYNKNKKWSYPTKFQIKKNFVYKSNSIIDMVNFIDNLEVK